jgi:TPR repeat protein
MTEGVKPGPAGEGHDAVPICGAFPGDDPVALCLLAWELRETNPARSVELYRKAAELGSPDAMYRLACALEPVEPTEAKEWMGKAAQLGDPWAKYTLDQPLNATDKAALVASAAFGDIDNMAVVAELLEDEDPDGARQWLERAASGGDVGSMEKLGEKLSVSVPAAAMQWSERAAELDATAAYNLGVKLRDADPGRAHQLWARGAEAGNGPATSRRSWPCTGCSRRTMTKATKRYAPGYGKSGTSCGTS